MTGEKGIMKYWFGHASAEPPDDKNEQKSSLAASCSLVRVTKEMWLANSLKQLPF